LSWRHFPKSIKRFDKLLGDMEPALSADPWLAGKEFSLADIGYAPYITRLDHLLLQFLWDKPPHIPAWYERLLERRAYKEGLEDWFNAGYLSLIKEKGTEVQSQVKAIVGRLS
jgi:glutathione S-transferase